MHKDNYFKFADIASPAAEAAARKKAGDMVEAYSSRPAVMEAQITEEWVASFFLKQRPTAPLTTAAMTATKELTTEDR